jgi:hypothetical protein
MAVIRVVNESHLLATLRQVDRRKWQQLTELWIHMEDGTNEDYYRVQLILPTLLPNAKQVSLKWKN